ncbi:MAG: N-acetylmuramoyl-L-alanine amidase [Clostridia bacterium]|nr:N-acetylmuramoyl-L-alanine amidase [Clostridia bacterium]
MKKGLNRLVIILYVVLSIVIVSSGLFVLEALPEGLSSTINSIIGDVDLPVNGNSLPGDVISDEKNEVIELPDSMSGVWLNINEDFVSTSASSAQEVIDEIEYYFNYYKNFLCDTIFIRPDLLGEFSSIYKADGTKLDVLQEIISAAKEEDYFIVLVVDEQMMFSGENDFSFYNVRYYLESYDFNAAVLSCKTVSATPKYYEAAKFLAYNMSYVLPDVYIGLETVVSSSGEYADSYFVSALNELDVDFVCINSSGSMKSSALNYSSVYSWFNSFAASYSDVNFYSIHRTDLVCTSTSDWNNYIEINDQLRYLWDCQNIDGSVFYDSSSLRRNKNNFAQRIAYLVVDGAYDDLSIQKIDINEANNTVTFIGNSAGGHKLYCNDEVQSNGGVFSLKYSLAAGENKFHFFSCGKNITYRVYNNSDLLLSYYPQTDVNVSKDETVYVYAVCMDNVTPYAVLNGNSYQMYPDNSVIFDYVPEGYSVFSCGISFENNSYADINLGNLTINAVLGNAQENVTCGRVTLLKSNTSAFLNKILEFVYLTFFSESLKPDEIVEEQENVYDVTPFSDNALGTALMCRIVYDDTEQLGPVSAYDTYQPTLSTLPAGTLDYVKNMTVSTEGYIRYELKSGISVYGVDCELINNAYVMPVNTASVAQVDETKTNSTDIIFDVDWLVPVTVQAYPQQYSVGYLNFSYNVSAFSAQYIDVKFNYTNQLLNASLLSFAPNSVISSYEVFASGTETIILRLHLRQAGQFYGFDMYTNEDGHLVLSLKKHNDNTLAGKVIMLDPGHGGLSMTGTAVADNSVAEATVTLSIANKVRQLLEAKGAIVVMSREMDTPLTLSQRAKLFGEQNPDIFVSIHCDGSENKADSGTHTFYFRSYSKPLAQAINENLVYNYRNYIYSPGDTNYSYVNRGTKYYPFYVTRLDNCPSVLVETGFMSNAIEGQVLTDDNCQYWLADGIAKGIEQYFAKNY